MHTNNQHGGLRTRKHGNVTWLDVSEPNKTLFAELEHDYKLHPVHLQESVQQVQHSQVERESNYLFFVIHVPRYEPSVNKLVVEQLGVFLGKDFLITVHHGASIKMIEQVYNGCGDETTRETYFRHGPAYLLYVLISHILDDIFAMTDRVTTELDSIEDYVFGNSVSDAQRISNVRQKIVKLRRVIGPKRLILADLTQQIDSFAGGGMTRYYSNNLKAVSKLWELVEEAKETVEIFKDADFTTSTEQTNKTLAILTLIFTFTIPVTVIGTLYGMNVPLPGGLATGAWAFWGRYTTLGLAVGVSAVLACLMYAYFRRKKWM